MTQPRRAVLNGAAKWVGGALIAVTTAAASAGAFAALTRTEITHLKESVGEMRVEMKQMGSELNLIKPDIAYVRGRIEEFMRQRERQ